MKSQSSVYANENRQKKALPDVEEQGKFRQYNKYSNIDI